MSVQEMEDFTSLMEGWGDGEVSLMTLSDDLGTGVYSSIKDENQYTSGIFEDVLEAPSRDPLAESWMEQTSLSQMLEELTGMAMETTPVPTTPVIEEKEVAEDVDCSVLADFGLGQDEFELLQHLVEKATEMDSDSSINPLFEQSSSDNIVGDGAIQVAPVISLDDSGISSLNSSVDHAITTLDLTEMDDNNFSQSSASDVESILSSSPSSPSSSISSSECSTSSELYKLMTQPTHKQYNSHRSTPYSSPSTSNKKSKVKSVSTDSDSLEAQFLSKKERKKLQNKNAAIRYRQKKKSEADDIKLEEDELQDKNDKLQEKVDELSREIAYMKNLMSEVYKARGNVKVEKVTISS